MDDPVIFDQQELDRRLRLATACCQRENERLALLARLIDRNAVKS